MSHRRTIAARMMATVALALVWTLTLGAITGCGSGGVSASGDGASTGAISDSYGEVLDNAARTGYWPGATMGLDNVKYALVELNGDGPRELLVQAKYTGGGYSAKLFYFDDSTHTARELNEGLSYEMELEDSGNGSIIMTTLDESFSEVYVTVTMENGRLQKRQGKTLPGSHRAITFYGLDDRAALKGLSS